MASDQNIYKVYLNNCLESYDYSFSFSLNKKPVMIALSDSSAVITVERTTKYKPEDIAYGKHDLFSETVKKVMLVHLLLYSKCIDIQSIRVVIKNKAFDFSIEDHNMRYVSTLIQNQVRPDFNENWHDKTLIETIIGTNKTKSDSRMSALYAFILSRSRKAVIERFVDLWISFNGMYSYFSSLYEKKTSQESEQLKRFIIQTGEGNIKIERSFTDRIARKVTEYLKNTNVAAINYEWLTGDEGQDFSNELVRQIKTEISTIEDEYKKQNEELNNKLKSASNDEKAKIKKSIQSNSDKIGKLATYKQYSNSAYIYLMVEYAYYFRCKYVHANEVLPLFTYNDEHIIRCIGLVNRLLDNYIDNNLYKWFSEQYINGTLKPLAQ